MDDPVDAPSIFMEDIFAEALVFTEMFAVPGIMVGGISTEHEIGDGLHSVVQNPPVLGSLGSQNSPAPTIPSPQYAVLFATV